MEDVSASALFPDDDHALGPFLGNLPPEILDAVVQKLGWFRTTFALAGKSCREAVARAPGTPSARLHPDPTNPAYPIEAAAIEGDGDAVEWLLDRYDEKRWWPFCHAPRDAVVHVVATRAATLGGHVDVLRRLYARGGSRSRAIRSNHATCAVYGGHLELLKWLVLENGCPLPPGAAEMAAERGHLDVLRWMRDETGCALDRTHYLAAARAGRVEVLSWLREARGVPWDASSLIAQHAAEAGRLEALRWARANGCPWDAHVFPCAARRGRLEIMRWLRRNGCPWDAWTCAVLAEGAHLEALRWARANGCPWDARTIAAAEAGGHDDVLRWARDNGCPEAEG